MQEQKQNNPDTLAGDLIRAKQDSKRSQMDPNFFQALQKNSEQEMRTRARKVFEQMSGMDKLMKFNPSQTEALWNQQTHALKSRSPQSALQAAGAPIPRGHLDEALLNRSLEEGSRGEATEEKEAGEPSGEGDTKAALGKKAASTIKDIALHPGFFKAMKGALSLASMLNKNIEAHQATVFMIALGFALLKDCMDLFFEVFEWATAFAGTLIAGPTEAVMSFFLWLFLTAFLWGKGTWRIKAVIWIVAFLEIIPIGLDALPMWSISVAYAWWRIARIARESQEDLEKLKKGGVQFMSAAGQDLAGQAAFASGGENMQEAAPA